MRYKRKQLYLMCLNNTVNILCFTAIFIATVALIIFYSDASKLTDKVTQNNTYVILPNRTSLKILKEKSPMKPTPSTYEFKFGVADVITTTERNEATDHGVNNIHGQKRQPTTINEYTTKSIIPPVVRTTERNTDIKSNVNTVKASIICKTLPQKDDFAKCGNRKADIKCCEYIWAMNYKEDILERLNCILKSSYGPNDSPAMFPHMVAVGWLRKDEPDKYQFRCSGSLISNKFVLTSARCIFTENISTAPIPRIVRLGVDNINKINDNNINDVEIDEPIYHPSYLSPQPYYDVALLKLKTSVIFTKKIHPACISTSFSTARFPKVNVTGWEVSNFDTKELFGRLQTSTLNMIRYETCHTKLQENAAYNEVWKKLRMHQVCADVEGGSNIWQGGSGSPIQVKINTKLGYMHTVIGVTSMSLIKGSNNLPGVYTSVSSVLTWIENTVWPEDEKDEFTSKYT